jgi:signal transduction histidine kinase
LISSHQAASLNNRYRAHGTRQKGTVKMSIRQRIILAFSVAMAAALIMAALLVWGAERGQHLIERGRRAHEQLTAIIALSAQADRYFKEASEYFLIGGDTDTAMQTARQRIEERFAELQRLFKNEVAFLKEKERASEAVESERLAAMRRVIAEIDDEIDAALRLVAAGKRQAAAVRFREATKDNRFAALAEAAIADERGEVAATDRQTTELGEWLVIFSLLIAGAAVLFSTLAGMALWRSLTRPLARLEEGAAAISGGDLGHRIAPAGRDELARLAIGFDAMAARLEAQRDRLLEVHKQLEDTVAQRTHELREANERLRRLDSVRSRFLADISHELRTPITVLRGEAEVTLRGADKPAAEYRETLSMIVRLAGELGRLVNDLLTLARSEAGEVEIERQKINLNEVLEVAGYEAKMLARQRNVKLNISLPEEAFPLIGDAQRLKQLFICLLDNAIKHSPAQAEITIVLHRINGACQVEITDRGPGIPEAELPHLFNRFYRGSGGGTTTGNGLGLPIARWITKAHDGQISLRNREGGGITVVIRLPLIPPADETGAAANREAKGDA